MKIIIEPIQGSRYKGTLLIDNEEIETTLQSRAGCCARTLMNKAMFIKGKPQETITLEIEGW
jgi:hypothetical protein